MRGLGRLSWIILLTGVVGISACRGPDEKPFGSSDPDTAPDQDDSDSKVDDSQGESRPDSESPPDSDSPVDSGVDQFDEPGDLVAAESEDGLMEVDLSDVSGDSNRAQQFYLVVSNTLEADLGFRLKYDPSSGANGPAKVPHRKAASKRVSHPAPARSAPEPFVGPPAPPLADTDIGTAQEEFLVRNSLQDDLSFDPRPTTLWALGDNVAIWVDEGVGIDLDCDGQVDSGPASFSICTSDLQLLADIIDDNIVPNVRSLFGDESDVDGDGRVSIVITPVLNDISLTASDEAYQDAPFYSYVEPSADLQEFDEVTNPLSDYKEVIYVFAPDPNGFTNTQLSAEAYTSYKVAAEVARSFTALVSYNQHVLLAGGEQEEDWLNDAMGTLAADLCGFGAAYYSDVWTYLDAPHLKPLVTDSSGSLESWDRGAQYLFARWLYDYQESLGEGSGASVFQSIMQTPAVGADAILNGTGTDLEDLALMWQVALLTTGVTNDAGAPLVDPTEWPPYAPPDVISAPPANPGSHYGANGYQTGINIRGINTPYSGGTTDTPVALTDDEIKVDGPDDYIYTPGFPFYGWMKGNYGSLFVKMTDVTYDAAEAVIQADSDGLVAAVIRWNDAVVPDYSVETIYSPLQVDRIPLPALPSDGSVVKGVGELSDSKEMTVVGITGSESDKEVKDTDIWLLDLTDRPVGQQVHVMIWMDRHFADSSGTPAPSDPWIAVAPAELVPEPTVADVTSLACSGSADFAFPASILEYLYSQDMLSSTMYPGEACVEGDSGVEEDCEPATLIDPCGVPSGVVTDCSNDWDLDGIIDEEEPVPTSFFEQVATWACTVEGAAPTDARFNTDWLDVDELDSNEIASRNIAAGAGGRSGEDGEEGFIDVVLEGGRQYTVVVGSSAGDTGPYEFSMREVF